MDTPKKVLVFLSGRGSNCRALIEYQKSNPSCGFEVIGVITDKPGVPGVYYVKEAQIPVYEFFRADYGTRPEFISAMFSLATSIAPDYFALAGFMVVVPDEFLKANQGKVINIHPSLLPEYPGLQTHARVIQDKKKVHGCTVHYVNEVVDGGEIIAQSRISVEKSDTPETVAAKVLREEHRLYCWTLEKLSGAHIKLKNDTLWFSDLAKKESREKKFILAGG